MSEQFDDFSEEKSKSQVKRELHALQDLGERLTTLKPDLLAKLPLTEPLQKALADAPKHKAHIARKRHMQYIGKLMRGTDPEPIRTGLALIRGESAAETARLHRLERLRERLLADEATLAEIAATWPTADLAYLRQLRRNALKEKEASKPPKNFRALYQALRELEMRAGEPDEY